MRVLIFFLLMVIPGISYCQFVRTILDKNTRSPVPFASVKVLHKPLGVIASDKGEFTLPIEKSDTILITCVGYYQLILTGEKIEDAIYLVPKIQSLPGVFLGSRKYFRTITIGHTEEITKNNVNWGPANLKEEFAQKISLPDSTFSYRIKKIYIPVKRYRCWGPLLVRMYKIDPGSEYPGEEIFSKYVALGNKDIKNQTALIDVSSDSIYLYNERGFFISVAWPDIANQNGCITTIQLSPSSKETSYSRYLASKDYHWFSFELHSYAESHHLRTIFSAEVDEFR